MKIIIGSVSDRKIKTVEKVTKQLLTSSNDLNVCGHAANSGVPNTPYDEQTYTGARNRAKESQLGAGEADYYIGLESGLVKRYGHLYEEAWSCIINKAGQEFFGYSSGLKVPDYILNKMNECEMEHCDVMEKLEEEFGKLPNDTWGTYSGGLILRDISLEEAIRNAFIQAIAPENSFYKK